MIAHQPPTVENPDAMMAMGHGCIIMWGTYQQLLAEKGQYYQLYTSTFESEQFR